MILERLSLDNVGCFSGQWRFGPFAPGLNVVDGPNERGKSTLLRALTSLFLDVPGSDRREVKRLRPYSGGQPRISAEFSSGDRRYRLEKRFRAGRDEAQLMDLSRGGTIAEGRSAHEEALSVVFGAERHPSWLAALWSEQTAVLQPFAWPTEGHPTLQALLADEVTAVAGGARRRHVRRALEKWLGEHETARAGRPKKGGPWSDALDAAQTAEQIAQELEVRAGAARERLERLETAVQAREALARPDLAARRAADIKATRAAFDEAGRAGEQLAAARTRYEAAGLHAANASKALATFDGAMAQLEQIRRDDETGQRAAVERSERRDVVTAAREDLRERMRLARSGVSAVEAAVRHHHAASERAHRLAAVERLSADLSRGHVLLDEQTTVLAGLAQSEVAASILRDVSALDRQIAALDVRIAERAAAVATVLTFELSASGRSTITVDGEPIAKRRTLRLSQTLTLDIGDLGRIHVAPPPSNLTSVEAERTALLERRADRLQASTSDAMDDIEALAAEHSSWIARRAACEAGLKQIAPEGVDALEASLRRAERDLDALDSQADEARPDVADGPEIEAAAGDVAALNALLAQRRDALEALEEQLRAADVELAELQRGEAVETEAAATRARQRLALEEDLPAADHQRNHREALASAAERANRDLLTAHATLEALVKTAPNPTELDRLAEAAEAAVQAEEVAKRRLTELSLEIRGLEAELARDRLDGVEQAAERARAAAGAARAEADRIEAAVRARRLLRTVLDQAEAEVRADMEAPIRRRMTPYVEMLFPDAQFDMDPGLGVARLDRRGLSEKNEALSVGTQEQVAVVARLGLARLLADRGRPLPLILDDALVYSDDDRIRRAFRALEAAAEHHQVIVLTCREATFADLGGHRPAWCKEPETAQVEA